VAPLHGAVTLAEVDDVPVLVTHDLKLDVPRTLQVLLDIHITVPKRGQRLGARQLKGPREVVGVAGHAHALSPASRRGLDDHGKANGLRELQRRFRIVDRPRRPRNDRHTDLHHRLSGGGFVPHEPNLLRRRSDKRHVGRGAGLGELGVLGEETVAGMDCVGPRDLGRGDDARDAEVRLARRRGTDADVVVGETDMERLAVGLGIHGHGLNAQLPTRADDPQRDFAAVRDQHLSKHG
jgi:hypothetical protein